jgi:hypothetical protein
MVKPLWVLAGLLSYASVKKAMLFFFKFLISYFSPEKDSSDLQNSEHNKTKNKQVKDWVKG